MPLRLPKMFHLCFNFPLTWQKKKRKAAVTPRQRELIQMMTLYFVKVEYSKNSIQGSVQITPNAKLCSYHLDKKWLRGIIGRHCHWLTSDIALICPRPIFLIFLWFCCCFLSFLSSIQIKNLDTISRFPSRTKHLSQRIPELPRAPRRWNKEENNKTIKCKVSYNYLTSSLKIPFFFLFFWKRQNHEWCDFKKTKQKVQSWKSHQFL